MFFGAVLIPGFGLLLVVSAVCGQEFFSEDRPVTPFIAITSSGPFFVNVSFAKTESLSIEADGRILPYIETAVESLTLNLRFSANYTRNVNYTEPINVFVEARSLTSLISSGTGPITVTSTWKAKDIELILSGTGDLSVPLNVNNINAVLSGTGNINASGKCKNANILTSGSGNFSAAELHAQVVNVQVYASSVVSIFVETGLSASVSGSGAIVYGGNPQLNQQATGKGKVVRADEFNNDVDQNE